MDNKDQPLIDKLYYNGKINPNFDIYVYFVFIVALGIGWHYGYFCDNLLPPFFLINLLFPEFLYTFLSIEKQTKKYSIAIVWSETFQPIEDVDSIIRIYPLYTK